METGAELWIFQGEASRIERCDGELLWCEDCDHWHGSDLVRSWKVEPFVCEFLEECWYSCKVQGERGHFCSFLKKNDAA